MHSIKVVIAII